MNRTLYRCRQNRVLTGVTAGVAEFFGLDATLVRVLWFVSILFGGAGLVIYIGLALIMPLEPIDQTAAGDQTVAGDETPAQHAHNAVPGHRHLSNGGGRLGMIVGALLILIGGVAVVEMLLPNVIAWRQLWPVAIVGIGAILVALSVRRREASSL